MKKGSPLIWQLQYLSYGPEMMKRFNTEFQRNHHNKLLIIKLNKDMKFDNNDDLPERALYYF